MYWGVTTIDHTPTVSADTPPHSTAVLPPYTSGIATSTAAELPRSHQGIAQETRTSVADVTSCAAPGSVSITVSVCSYTHCPPAATPAAQNTKDRAHTVTQAYSNNTALLQATTHHTRVGSVQEPTYPQGRTSSHLPCTACDAGSKTAACKQQHKQQQTQTRQVHKFSQVITH
jgi:hypothetical protein